MRYINLYIISNDDLYANTECYSMATEIKHRRHRWLGHVLRMEQKKDSLEGLKIESSRQKETGKGKNYPEKNL